MSGGINAWNSKSYPTTSAVAPILMQVADVTNASDTLIIGTTDTLNFTITNRGNDILNFTSIALPYGDEFTTDFDLNKQLRGAEDYSFSMYYSPKSIASDLTQIVLESNGGQLALDVFLKADSNTNINTNNLTDLLIYPNPVKNSLFIKSASLSEIEEIYILNLNGQVVFQKTNVSSADKISTTHLKNGVYLLKIKNKEKFETKKIIIQH